MQKADHSGHRSRMRKRYLISGLSAFSEHEILELLLYYVIPLKNTNELAKDLISRFGNLSAVFDAPRDALFEAGLTENQVVFLKLFPDVTRHYYLEKYEKDNGPLDFDNLPGYITRHFIGFGAEERVLLILCDTKGKEVYCGFISEGNFEESQLSVRKIMRLAMNYGAVTAVLAHNHPSGVALPSVADIRATLQLRETMAPLGVNLIDHFIVARDECISMAQSGFFE